MCEYANNTLENLLDQNKSKTNNVSGIFKHPEEEQIATS